MFPMDSVNVDDNHVLNPFSTNRFNAGPVRLSSIVHALTIGLRCCTMGRRQHRASAIPRGQNVAFWIMSVCWFLMFQKYQHALISCKVFRRMCYYQLNHVDTLIIVAVRVSAFRWIARGPMSMDYQLIHLLGMSYCHRLIDLPKRAVLI